MPSAHSRLRPSFYLVQTSNQSSTTNDIQRRAKLFFLGLGLFGLLLIARLAYWQVWRHDDLTQVAESQYQRQIQYAGVRGSLYFADGSPLVTNQRVYRLFATPHLLNSSEREVTARVLAQIVSASLSATLNYQKVASSSAFLTDLDLVSSSNLSEELTTNFLHKLNKPDSRWISLYQPLDEDAKQAISNLQLPAVGFDAYYQRLYPEASMAAHLTGFVGKNDDGEDVGYFGLEGALNSELVPAKKTKLVLANALGFPLFAGDGESGSLDGRSVTTTIRRDVQYLLEQKLKQGMQRYGAEKGEIVVIQPQTGAILGLATWPNYDPAHFNDFPTELYKNPTLADTYEPGSTFKVLTVAAGIDAGVITPDSICTNCDGPRQFGQYTLKTWNEEYHPNINIRDAVAKSDNIAMIFVAEKLGSEKFNQYIHQFGIGSRIGIDLQEDTSTPFSDAVRPVELATTSFGQGIVTNSLQMLRAVGVIANQGILVSPRIIERVHDPIAENDLLASESESPRVLSTQTAQQVTDMMVYAAQKGEAQWTVSKTHSVAGKTGTAQIAEKGGYAEFGTLASYIGFAPPYNPQFIMQVKLTRPESSPWAAETAAPLWYDTAKELYLLLGIPPDRLPE